MIFILAVWGAATGMLLWLLGGSVPTEDDAPPLEGDGTE